MSLSYTAGARFIRPSEVIQRLKSTRTLVGLSESDFHVLGAGDYLKAVESGTFIQNANAALYVLCGNSSSSLITDAGLGSNEVLHTIDVVLYIRARDNRAQYSDQLSVWFKEYLTRSLIGYSNDAGQPLMFGGDSFNSVNNVSDYSRTFQFNQRVFVDGDDLIGNDGVYSDLDDFFQIYNTINADSPDFGDETDVDQYVYLSSTPDLDNIESYGTFTAPVGRVFDVGIWVDQAGTNLYTAESLSDRVRQYGFTKPYDVSTLNTGTQSGAIVSTLSSVAASDDGLYYATCEGVNSIIRQRLVSSAFDLSSSTTNLGDDGQGSPTAAIIDIHYGDGGNYAFYFNYVSAGGASNIYRYALSTPYDCTTGTYDNNTYDFSSDVTFGGTGRSMCFASTGLFLFVGNNTDTIYQFSLSEAWDLSTATLAGSKTFSHSVSGMALADDRYLYLSDSVTDKIYGYRFLVA